MNVHLVSLGCARTLVDSEVALADLKKHGYRILAELSGADIAIVNTCGFIEEAKTESIDTILELCELKKRGALKAVVVLGCLAQRYPDAIKKELAEVDGVIGTNDFGRLAEVLEPIRKKQKVFRVEPRPRYLLDENTERYSLTPSHYTYVKISEGCINACSYCVIPQMKGAHRSRSVESIVKEVQNLSKSGKISEVNLIGQDTAAFGFDRSRVFELPRLLEELALKGGVPWIRFLYAHPGHVTQELVDVVSRYENICRYVDFPIEHSHDAMLKRMNRGVTRGQMQWALDELRRKVPGIGIRTTVIVGFPGETDEEFEDLMRFLNEARFERLGAFIFSQEEGSKAFAMSDQIPENIKKERYDAVMKQQQRISKKIHDSLIGKKIDVLIDECDPGEPGVYRGRSHWDAPEVDGEITVRSTKELSPGAIVSVRVEQAMEYDLEAVAAG